MPKSSRRVSLYRLVSTLALASSVSAHSWIEYAVRIAPNGTMVGHRGFPRGYLARGQPGFSDKVPQHLLPADGQAAYSGHEILNKFPPEANPGYPLLQASPGEHVALIHLENGHVSLPQNQPKKPRNRGTIFLYGTAQPRDREKLFDVHLRWNRDGTGGDRRGILLGTRDYDDGQCFQPNTAAITSERASLLSGDGAKTSRELPCQSDIKLPEDLKPGTVYTIYWYWDWPDLNAERIDLDKTKDGSYPWAGSLMRGDAVPAGWTMDMIAKNESYASVIDISIVDDRPRAFSAKEDGGRQKWVAQQNIYSKAIEAQMKTNFQVAVGDVGSGSAGSGSAPAPGARPPTSGPAPAPAPAPLPSAAHSFPPPPAPAVPAPSGPGAVVTVTQTVTVPPTTILETVYRTRASGGQAFPAAPADGDVTITLTSHVRPAQPAPTGGPHHRRRPVRFEA